MLDDKNYNDSEILRNGSDPLDEKEVEANACDENFKESIEDINKNDGAQEEQADACEKADNEVKGEDPQVEEKSFEEKGEDHQEPIHGNTVNEPTEYVWNSSDDQFRGRRESFGATERNAMYSQYGYAQPSYSYRPNNEMNVKKKRSAKPFIIILVSVLAAIFTLAFFVLGAFGGYLLGGEPLPDFYDVYVGDSSTDKNQTVNMTKNDSAVEVNIEPGSTGYTSLRRTEVVELVADAVVEITTSKVQTNSFFGGNYVTSGAGSGVVIAQSEQYAFIVTNYHVIEGATKVHITITDGTVVEAEYLDGDMANDIAMLRIKTDKTFPKIVCGSSDNLKVGEDVVAIGNPLGSLGGTVTEGIVSALDREITVDGIKMSLIQTSAAVNPGNSGGGLFNMAGELVGIVNAKQAAEGIEGLGFAIPIDSVYDMLIEIIETKYIHGRPTLGIEAEYVSDTWTAYMKYGVGTSGVFVTSSSNSALKAKDLIRSINGQLVTDTSSYAAAISSLNVGDKVTVEVYRNARLLTVEVEVTEYVPAGMFG